MITGTTKSGFSFSLPENAVDNMELIDALADSMDDDPLAVSRVCRLFLGEETRKSLYGHLRSEHGRVPVTAVVQELKDMFAAFGKQGKNSSSSPE